MDVKEILQNSSDALLNFFRNAVDRRYEEKIALAVAHQKEEDVCCAIAILLEMKTPENEIMRMLSKFYGIDSIAAVTACKEKVKPQIGLAARKFGRRWGERSAAQISHHKVPA